MQINPVSIYYHHANIRRLSNGDKQFKMLIIQAPLQKSRMQCDDVTERAPLQHQTLENKHKYNIDKAFMSVPYINEVGHG